MSFNSKDIFATVNEWISGLVTLFSGFIAVGVLVELVMGSPIFGVSVVANLIGLIGQFGEGGFPGLLALLILVGLWNKK